MNGRHDGYVLGPERSKSASASMLSRTLITDNVADSDVCWGRCFAVVWRYSHSESQALQLQWLNRDGHLLFARTERCLPLRRLKVYTASSDNRESIPAFSPWAFWGLPNQRSNPQKRTAGLQNIFTSPRVPNQRSLSASPLKEGSVDTPWQNG